MASGRILVLAQDYDYRRSLAFLLEAEGFEVFESPELPLPADSEHDCIVLDHRVLHPIDPAAALDFCLNSNPVILLGARAPTWFSRTGCLHVETPIVENRLITVIRSVIADRSASPSI